MPIKPKFLLLKTYLAVIKGSVGSKTFRRCYFKIGGKDSDVLENGNLACAFYLSTTLKVFSLIKEVHTTVNAAEKDLIASGWKKIKKPKVGCVIIYEPKPGFPGGKYHRHLGFYIGNGKVVDNHSRKGMPVVHKWNYRPVQSLWWHKKLKP